MMSTANVRNGFRIARPRDCKSDWRSGNAGSRLQGIRVDGVSCRRRFQYHRVSRTARAGLQRQDCITAQMSFECKLLFPNGEHAQVCSAQV